MKNDFSFFWPSLSPDAHLVDTLYTVHRAVTMPAGQGITIPDAERVSACLLLRCFRISSGFFMVTAPQTGVPVTTKKLTAFGSWRQAMTMLETSSPVSSARWPAELVRVPAGRRFLMATELEHQQQGIPAVLSSVCRAAGAFQPPGRLPTPSPASRPSPDIPGSDTVPRYRTSLQPYPSIFTRASSSRAGTPGLPEICNPSMGFGIRPSRHNFRNWDLVLQRASSSPPVPCFQLQQQAHAGPFALLRHLLFRI